MRSISVASAETALCRYVAAAVVLVFSFLLSSCSGGGTESPYDAVPAGATRVTAVDLNLLAAACGDNITDNSGEITDAARGAFSSLLPSSLVRPLLAVLYSSETSVDTHNVIYFTAANGYRGLILGVTDRDALTSGSLSSYRQKEEDFDGYEVYEVGKRLIAVSKHLCVIAPDEATVKSCRKDKKSPVALAELKDFLTQECAVRAAAEGSSVYGKKMADMWLCNAVKFSESAITTDLTALHADGTTDSIGVRLAAPIDAAALSFVPKGASLVVASGLQGEEGKLFGVEKLLTKFFPGDATMSRTGTTVFYCRPAGSLDSENYLTPSVWNFGSALEMPQDDGEKAVRNMQTYTDGFAQLDPETQCYVYSKGDDTLTYGYVNGYFLQAFNGNVVTNSKPDMLDDFNGARIAALLDIPKGSELQQAAGLPCGASLSLRVTDCHLRLKLSLYGNSTPVLSTVNSLPMLHGVLKLITFNAE